MTLGVFAFRGLSLRVLPNIVYKMCYFVNSAVTCFIIRRVMYDGRASLTRLWGDFGELAKIRYVPFVSNVWV